MSATPPTTPPTAPDAATPSPFFKPWTLLLGFALGLVLLALAGRAVGKKDLHPDAVRFHPMIAPESQYEPTMAEMRAFVRARCRPDQILVIVGGNSILLGVGQPADHIWTKRLQELLGDRFAVVNLAFRGASPTDGGAFVAESLRDEFPRQIYLANVSPLVGADAIGIESYCFIFLDAFYKGLLLPWAPRNEDLRAYLGDTFSRPARFENNLGARTDAWLHFRDFWNAWSSTIFFTFGTPYQPNPKLAFQPRNRFRDEETDFDTQPFEQRFTPTVVAADTVIARAVSSTGYIRAADGTWQLNQANYNDFFRLATRMFPDSLKNRTLILVGRNSPFYTRLFEPELLAVGELGIRDTINAWEKIGYAAMDFGRDFTVEDYGDRTHLTTSGGIKLAANTAPHVLALAEKLGYLKP
jgi:hypothetical protein